MTKLGGRRKRWDGKIILSLWTGNLRCHERWLQEKKAPCGPGRFARKKYSTNRISRPESSPEPTADETENEGFHPFHCQIKCTARILFGVFIYTSTVKLNQASANCFRRRNRPVNMKGLEQNFSRQYNWAAVPRKMTSTMKMSPLPFQVFHSCRRPSLSICSIKHAFKISTGNGTGTLPF